MSENTYSVSKIILQMIDIIEDSGLYKFYGYSKDFSGPVYVLDYSSNNYIESTLPELYSKVKNADVDNKKKRRFNSTLELQVELDVRFGPGEFILLGEYKTMRTPIRTRHSCGYEYEVTPYALLDNRKIQSTCSNCVSLSKSSGEMLIQDFLSRNNIEYIPQYKDVRCKDKRELPFDFAIFRNNKLKMLIEFDGEQHFMPIERWGGEENFMRVQRHDVLKDLFCKYNNIPLLRIPYTKKNEIDTILSSCVY